MPGKTTIPVERLRELLAKGATVKQIMLRLGITKTSVYRVAREAKQ